MSAHHEKIAHMAVLALFGRKDPRTLLPYVHPRIQRYGPDSAYAEHGAPAFFARLAERRSDRPAGRLTVETLTVTAELVAIGWNYVATRPRYAPHVRTVETECLQGALVLRFEPQSEKITHLWQMGDDLNPFTLASLPQPLPASTDPARRKTVIGGREAQHMTAWAAHVHTRTSANLTASPESLQ